MNCFGVDVAYVEMHVFFDALSVSTDDGCQTETRSCPLRSW